MLPDNGGLVRRQLDTEPKDKKALAQETPTNVCRTLFLSLINGTNLWKLIDGFNILDQKIFHEKERSFYF